MFYTHNKRPPVVFELLRKPFWHRARFDNNLRINHTTTTATTKMVSGFSKNNESCHLKGVLVKYEKYWTLSYF